MLGPERRVVVTRVPRIANSNSTNKSFFVRDADGRPIHAPAGQVASGRHKVINNGFSLPDKDKDHGLLAEVGLYYRIATPSDAEASSAPAPQPNPSPTVVVDVTQPNPAITLDDIGDDVDVDALIASTQRNTIPGDPARAAAPPMVSGRRPLGGEDGSGSD
eukprot:scaffold4038_cov118-Isochrysis_galbana.AAC.2